MTGVTATQSSHPYRRWQIQIFTSTWLAYAGYYFCRMAFYVTKSNMGIDLGFDSMTLAHLGTAYLTGYMIGQFSSAFCGRLLGPKRLLLIGVLISVACNVFFGLSNSFWTVLVFMGLNGLAQGTGWPGCIGSLAFWFKRKQRGTVLGVWSTCYQAGPVLASAFAALMLGWMGWRYSFFGASAVLLCVWAVILFFHPNRPESVGLKPLQDEDDEEELENTQEGKLSSLGWSKDVVITIVMMGLIYFTIKFLRYTLFSWAPFFLSRNFGLAGDDAGYLSTIFQACGFGGVLFAGFISDKLFKGRRSFLSFAMVGMMMLSFLFMVLFGSTSLFYFTVSMGLAGFMLYGPDSLLSGVGAIDVGSKRGALTAAGIINGMGSIGPIFQEQIIGWMYKFFKSDLYPILVLLFCMAAVGTILTLLLWLRSRRGKSKL